MSARDPVSVADLTAPGSRTEVASATHIGPVRTENQDAYAVAAIPGGPGIALLLADGMGGQAGGGEAASAAIHAAVASLEGAEVSHEAAAAALHAANRDVAELRGRIGGQPGTTLTVALVTAGSAVIGHAGDSRAYLVRHGRATPVTSDHSWVGDQVRAGTLEPGSERRHPRRNVITMAVMGDEIAPQVLAQPLEAGDLLMLCSDGFWEPLSDAQIAELLGTPGPLTAVVGRAAEAALDAGGTDNVTLLALRVPG